MAEDSQTTEQNLPSWATWGELKTLGHALDNLKNPVITDAEKQQIAGKLAGDQLNRVAQGSELTWHNPDGSVSHTSMTLSPDFVRKYGMPTRDENGMLTGAWSQTPIPAMPTPTAAEAQKMASQMGDFFDTLDALAPVTSKMIQADPRMLFITPEIASVTKGYIGSQNSATAVIDYLVSDLNVIDYTHWSKAGNEGAVTAQFFNDYGKYFNQQELDILASSFSAVSGRAQNNIAALAWRWINNGQGGVDLTQDTARADLLKFVYEQSAKASGDEAASHTVWGGIGNIIDAPRRAVVNAVSEGLAWATSIGDPISNTYRSSLTVGQNIALTMGYDPSEKGWSTASGFFDAVGAIAGDPVNWAFGAGVGFKLAHELPDAVMYATKGERYLDAMKGLIPFLGKKSVELPMFSRAPSIRFFYKMFSKSEEQLIARMAEKGIFEHMFELMKGSGGWASVVEHYPQLERLSGGAGYEMMKNARSADEVKDIFTNFRKLNYLTEDSADYVKIVNELEAAKKERAAIVNEDAAAGVLSAQEVHAGAGYKGSAVRAGAYEGKIEPGAHLAKSALNDSKTEKIVFQGDVKVLAMNKTRLKRFTSWASKLRKAAYGVESRLTNVAADEDTVKLLIGQGTLLKARGTGTQIAETALSDGRKLTISHEAGNFMAYVDGKAIGGLSIPGESVGLAQEFRRATGLTTEGGLSVAQFLTEQAHKVDPNVFDGLLAGNGSISKAGAAFIRKEAKRLGVEVPLLDAKVSTFDKMVENVMKGDAAAIGRSPKQRALFMQFAELEGADLLNFEHGSILTTSGASKAVKAKDDATIIRDATKWNQIDQQIMELESKVRSIKSGSRDHWVIVDLPTKKMNAELMDLKFWRKFASNDGQGWWARFRRTQAAKVFGQPAGKAIDLKDGMVGGRDLRNFLRQLGVSREFALQAYNDFLDAPLEMRWQAVADILTRAGEHIDNPVIKEGLYQIVQKQGAFSFGRIGGAEVLTGASLSRDGVEVALPYMPTMLADQFQLPGQDFLDMVTRYRQSGLLSSLGLDGSMVKGLTKSTRDARLKIAERYRDMLIQRGVDISAYGPEDFLRMAYSKVAGKGDTSGVGRLARAYEMAKIGPRKFFKAFTVLQLAGRFVTWPFRVALLEEGMRGQFWELPSMYRNPIRYFNTLHDSWIIDHAATYAARRDEAIFKFVGDMIPKGTDWSPEKLKALKTALPEFADFLGEATPSSAMGARAALATFLDTAEPNTLNDLSRGTEIAADAMKRYTKKIDRAKEVLAKYRLKPDFNIYDVDEIMNRGFTARMADFHASGAHVIDYVDDQMTEAGLRAAGDAWGQRVIHHMNDPLFSRFGLGRVISRANGEGVAALDGRALINDPLWSRMRPIAQNAADHHGWDYVVRLENGAVDADATAIKLADEYLARVVDPMTKEIFSPLYGDDPGAIAESLRKRVLMTPEGKTLPVKLTGSNDGAGQAFLRDFMERNHGKGLPFPTQISGTFDARMLFDDAGNPLTKGVQKVVSSIMKWSGEEVTQRLNRHPAWISAFSDHFEYYRNTLKLPEDVARTMARNKASEIVNYVFFNLDNTTPFVRSMNNIFPFFGAMWEVMQTWFYKIPAAGGTLAGPAMMVDKVQRVLRSLHDTGLLEYEKNFNPDGSVKDVTMYLNFSTQPEAGTPVGDAISKAGAEMLKAPLILAHALTGILNLVRSEDNKIKWDVPEDTNIKYNVGNPLALTGSMAHGIMAVNQMYLGLDPLKAYALNKAMKFAGLSVDVKLQDVNPGDTLADAIKASGADPGMFIRLNATRLREDLGDDTYARLLRGTLDPNEVTFDKADALDIPGTSLMDSYLRNMVFPFGVQDTVQGQVYQVLPSWSSFALRGLGVWASDGDAQQWMNVDKEGNVVLPGGLLTALTTKSTKMQVVGEINNQLLDLEATDVVNGKGIITRWKDQLAAFEALTEKYQAKGGTIVGSGDTATIIGDIVDQQLADQWATEKEKLAELNARIIKKAVDNAGGVLFIRGIMGMMGPANPQLLTQTQQDTHLYWDAMSMAAGDIRGSANWNLPPTLEDFAVRQALVTEFLNDPSGDSAKVWLKENYPELGVFTNGKTFWGPGGKPPEVQSIDEYFAQVEAGYRKPLPPEIMMQKIARSDVATEREVALKDKFGTDPWQAASEIVNNWNDYIDILNQAKVEYAGLQWWDANYDASNYEKWLGRNSFDALTLPEELSKRFQNITDTINSLEAFVPSQDMTDSERRDYTNALKNVAAGLKDYVGAWRSQLNQSGYSSPRDEALSWYFDTVQAPYYEQLAKLYDSVDQATDSEAKSRIYEDIRQYQTEIATTSYFGEGGTSFPNPLDFSWNKKTPEEQQNRLLRWFALKPEWLGYDATKRIVAQAPGLSKYLPSSPADFDIYREYNNKLADLADMKEPDPTTGIAQLTDSEYSKAKQNLDAQLRQYLINNGREGELQYMDMWPIERLYMAGMLPAGLDKYASYATATRQELDRIGKGPTSIVGQALMDRIYAELLNDIALNPVLGDQIKKLGGTMYDKSSIDSIWPSLFFNGTFGEM